jgi:hypothetical protein
MGAGKMKLLSCGFPEPVSVMAMVGPQPLRLWQAAEDSRSPRPITDWACGHEEADRAAISVGDGMQFCVHAALCAADQTAPLVAGSPFFDRRLVAVGCAFRYLRRHVRTNGACLPTSIITVFGIVASAIRPSIIRTKTPLSLYRFQRS